MAEVVFNMVALVFQCVERFVLHFPPSATALNQGDDIVFINDNVCNPAVSVSGITCDGGLWIDITSHAV